MRSSHVDRDGPGTMLRNPKGPCTQIVDTLALMSSLYTYFGAKVYTIWVHGPLGKDKGSI